MNAQSMPRPRVNLDNAPFWAGCRRHTLLLPVCEDCGRAHLPPGPVCPFCFGERLAWQSASGLGTISSWVIVHKAWFPALAARIPYNVVQVELVEGPRLVADLVGLGAVQPRVGDPVSVVFDDIDPDLTLPRFILVTAQPA